MWTDIEKAISDTSDTPFKIESMHEISGGCINRTVRLQGHDCAYFAKLNSASQLPMFAAEAVGLRAIAATRTLRVPNPVVWGTTADQSWLILEYIPLAHSDISTEALLGKQLAAMHRTTNRQFGWQEDNFIGSSIQSNRWEDTWSSFLRDQRLAFQLELAARHGAPTTLLEKGKHLLLLLPGILDGYHPQASLLHGDLWSGNRAADDEGQPVIFDPAVYFGDREADLAMTELFGGFGESFYRAYRAAWPLEDGYEVRKRLYNLYHLLNHFNLFGGAYALQAERSMDFLLGQ